MPLKFFGMKENSGIMYFKSIASRKSTNDNINVKKVNNYGYQIMKERIMGKKSVIKKMKNLYSNKTIKYFSIYPIVFGFGIVFFLNWRNFDDSLAYYKAKLEIAKLITIVFTGIQVMIYNIIKYAT